MHYFSNFETKFFKLSIDYVFFNLYLFKLSSKSTFSLLFWNLLNIDLFFTFLSIDSQPCSRVSLIKENYERRVA